MVSVGDRGYEKIADYEGAPCCAGSLPNVLWVCWVEPVSHLDEQHHRHVQLCPSTQCEKILLSAPDDAD